MTELVRMILVTKLTKEGPILRLSYNTVPGSVTVSDIIFSGWIGVDMPASASTYAHPPVLFTSSRDDLRHLIKLLSEELYKQCKCCVNSCHNVEFCFGAPSGFCFVFFFNILGPAAGWTRVCGILRWREDCNHILRTQPPHGCPVATSLDSKALGQYYVGSVI